MFLFGLNKKLGPIVDWNLELSDKKISVDTENLEAASISIDMVGMLQEKTKNNLEEYESTLLEKTLNDLRMNFVFEKNQGTVEEKNAEPEVSKEPKKDKKQAPKKKKK